MSLIFKDVVGKEDKYSVTNDGRVWSKISKKFLKPFKQKNGYLTLYLGAGAKNKKEVHRLVFEAFYRRLLPNEQAHHINQNQNDNRPQNLVAKNASEHASYHNSKRIRTEESNKKRSEKLKGRIVSQQTRKKLSEVNKGKHLSQQTRKKMSQSRKGRTPWNKGLKLKNL